MVDNVKFRSHLRKWFSKSPLKRNQMLTIATLFHDRGSRKEFKREENICAMIGNLVLRSDTYLSTCAGSFCIHTAHSLQTGAIWGIEDAIESH